MPKALISGIYRIRCLSNNKFYIGSSYDIKNRWKEHLSLLRNNCHHSRYMQNCWNKYGADQFEFKRLETCIIAQLLIREQFYLDILCPPFNTCLIAGSRLGSKASQETIEKLRKIHLGAKRSLATKLAIAKALKGNQNGLGRYVSAEQRKAASERRKGKPGTRLGMVTPIETRIKISDAQRGIPRPYARRKHTLEARKKMSEAMKGNKNGIGHKITPEHMSKLLATNVGAIRSDEAKKNMSEAQKRAWAEGKYANNQRWGNRNVSITA